MKRVNFTLRNKYESKEMYFVTIQTEENTVLRIYLHFLSTVSDVGVVGEVGSNAFYTFSIELCRHHRKKTKTGSLEMTYGFRTTERGRSGLSILGKPSERSINT